MVTHIGAKELRKDMADALNRVAYRGERIVVKRRGKKVAVLVPVEDAALLERLEEQVDLEEAKRSLGDRKAKPIPYRKVRKALGLK